MAIAVDGSSSFTDGDTIQDPYVGPTITPPAGSKIYAAVMCFAQSSDDNSEIVASGGALTWTRLVGLDQLHDGGSVAPPPIAIYYAEGTGASFQVTQECIDGLGFAHVQGVLVVTGGGDVIDTGTFTGLAAASIGLTATAAGQLAYIAMCDWGNTSDTPVKADPAMTTRYDGPPTGDVQTSYCGTLFSTGAGTVTVGTQLLSNPQGTNAVAILIAAAEEAEEYFVSASWSAESSLTASAVTTAMASASMSAQSNMAASAVTTAHASASWSAESAMSATAVTAAQASASWSGESSLTANAVTTAFASASWSAQSSMTLNASGAVIIPGTGVGGGTTPAVTPGGATPTVTPSGSTPLAVASGYP